VAPDETHDSEWLLTALWACSWPVSGLPANANHAKFPDSPLRVSSLVVEVELAQERAKPRCFSGTLGVASSSSGFLLEAKFECAPLSIGAKSP